MRSSITILIIILLSFNAYSKSKTDSLRHIIETTSNDSLKIMAYADLSDELINDPKKVLELLSEMNLFSQKIKNIKHKALCLRKIGAIYSFLNYFDKALEFTYQSAELFEKANDKYGLSYCYNNIGNFYNYKGEFTKDSRFQERSIEYHLKSIQLRDTIKDSIPLMNSYNNIGNSYKAIGNYSTALKYYNKSYAMALKSNDVKFLEMISQNLGSCYLTLGLNQKDPMLFKQALFFLMNVVKNYHGNNPSRSYANTFASIGEIYKQMGNLSLGITYLQKALDMAKDVHDKSAIKDAALGLSSAYEKKGDYVKALELMHLYNSNKDSLVNEKNSNSIEEMQVLYQSSKKDKEIEKLNIEKRITDAEISRQRTITFATISGLALIILLGAVLYSRYNLKKKANLRLTHAYNNIELKNRQITDSINYAKRLQNAILPPQELLNKNLKNFFIYYSPKDIVSGDFYWFSKHNGKLFFIVADCTGHGVPGALMSMIGNTLLNEIINQKNIEEPGDILCHLNNGITAALRQNTNDILTQDDGMDVSIVCFKENDPLSIKYATANHSIFVKNDKGITELSGDIYSIGGSMGINDKSFATYEYKAEPESFIVMSSDGYFDQFGGPSNSKFLITRFEEMLKRSNLNVNADMIMKEEMTSWKHAHKQTDDILVAGFKI